MKKKIIVIVLSFLLITPPYLFADWLSDWFDQYTASGPGYYESQKRGYVTFGSFSARTGMSSTPVNLINIELPRIRGGCGGIDLFLGSFGFVNFEYLVQMFQNLIQAAPIVAFDLALKVLSPSLSDTVKSVQNFLNELNSLQFDECKLLQPLLTVDVNKYKGDPLSVRAAAVARDVSNGTESLFKKAMDKLRSIFGGGGGASNISNEEFKKAIEGCPAFLKEIAEKYGGSIVDYVASRYNLDDQLRDMIRAVTGDTRVVQIDGKYALKYISPILKPQDLRENRIVGMDRDGNARQVNLQLVPYVYSILIEAYTAKMNRSTVSKNYRDLAQISPLPVDFLVNVSVLTKNPSMLAGITPSVAQGIFFNLASTVISEAVGYINRVEEVGVDPQVCGIYHHFRASRNEMIDNAYRNLEVLSELYKDALNEANLTLNIATRILDYANILKSELAGKYNLATISSLIMRSLAR